MSKNSTVGTLYLTATHLIFVDPEANKETWVSEQFYKNTEFNIIMNVNIVYKLERTKLKIKHLKDTFSIELILSYLFKVL